MKIHKNMLVHLSISLTSRRASILNAISWNQFCRSMLLKFNSFAFSRYFVSILELLTVVSMFHQNLLKTLVYDIENSASESIQLIVPTMKVCTTTLHFKIMLSNNWSIETKRAVFIISRCIGQTQLNDNMVLDFFENQSNKLKVSLNKEREMNQNKQTPKTNLKDLCN